ncbi:MAG: hypothetical protein JWP35_1296 [Caulobacter sp.]|nr:hypothetical protein [Caulobacter sp.]
MRIATCLLALALAAAPLALHTTAQAAPRRVAHKPAGTVIRDPQVFVSGVYARLVKGGPYQPPQDIYSARLDALTASMVRDAKDEVPRVDFLFWINGQDGDITDAVVTSADVEQRPQGDRKVVVARFKNSGKVQELHLYFERTPAGWKLDDVESVKDQTWTLSLLMKFGWIDR